MVITWFFPPGLIVTPHVVFRQDVPACGDGPGQGQEVQEGDLGVAGLELQVYEGLDVLPGVAGHHPKPVHEVRPVVRSGLVVAREVTALLVGRRA